MEPSRDRRAIGLRSLVVAAAVAALVTACSGAGGTTGPDASARSGSSASTRPPLPQNVPSGPAIDRHLERVPADFDPVAWTDLPPRPALEGPLAANRLITDAPISGEAELEHAEDVAPGLDGNLYTGTVDGRLWRIVTDGADVTRIEHVATLPGTVLGLDAYTEDVMIAAVPRHGLMAVNLETGRSWVLTDQLNGYRIFFPDGVAVAEDSTIYFTEASTRYNPGFPLDFLDGRPRGRLLRYEPATGDTKLVADDLYFANGVVVDREETYALVAESFRFRITRVWLDGARAGTTEPFGPDLINGADNLRMDAGGRVWVGGSDLRSDVVDAALGSADLRRQLVNATSEQVANTRAPYGFAQVLSAEGDPIFSFHDPTGRYFGVSAALPHDGFITFGSLRDAGVARIPIPLELR